MIPFLSSEWIAATPGDGEITERVSKRRVDVGTWVVLAVCAGVTIVRSGDL